MKKRLLLLFALFLPMVIWAQQISVHPETLSGFSYFEDEGGPSEESTFVVSATGLAGGFLNRHDTLLITASEYFEISTQSAIGFGEPIRLYADATGTVEATTIYVRMVEGLLVGHYVENILVSSQLGFAQSVTVNCNGTVTKRTLPTPTLSLEGNTYEGAQELEINSDVEGASIKYRTSLLEEWQDYTQPILVDRDMTICAKATKEGYYDSEEVCANYSIEYTIIATADSELGEVEGSGTYHYGDIVQLIATPNTCYEFSSWSNGAANSTIDIPVTGHDTIQAYFEGINYQITAVAYEGGTVNGGGTYQFPNSSTVTATPNDGYAFDYWTENGEVVSDELIYEISGCASHVLEAHFVRAILPTIEGDLHAPEPICAGSSLQLWEPEVSYADNEEWQISPDTCFSFFIAYTDQVLDEAYNNWWVRYMASNEVGTTYSDHVAITVYPVVETDAIVAIEGKKCGDKIEHILVYPKAGYCYQWYLDDVALADTTQYIHNENGLQSGIYRVEIGLSRDTEGQIRCSMSSPEYEVRWLGKSVYPNPSRSQSILYVENDSDEDAILTVFSSDGKTVYRQYLGTGQNVLGINLQRGIYLFSIADSQNIRTEKVIIQ